MSKEKDSKPAVDSESSNTDKNDSVPRLTWKKRIRNWLKNPSLIRSKPRKAIDPESSMNEPEKISSAPRKSIVAEHSMNVKKQDAYISSDSCSETSNDSESACWPIGTPSKRSSKSWRSKILYEEEYETVEYESRRWPSTGSNFSMSVFDFENRAINNQVAQVSSTTKKDSKIIKN